MTVTSYTERAGHKIDETDGLSVPWSRPSPKRKGVSARAVSAVTILVVLALWALSARLQLVSPVFLPSPIAGWNKFITVARDGFVDATLLQHAVASLWRVFAALVAALAIGVPVGLAIGISTIGRGIFDPLLEFLRPI
ncbi:taurine ABC transporter permease, partial [Mesorhizobium sp. M7A.T.Ca.TU.009.01.1.1]